jgi:hypothetical protein
MPIRINLLAEAQANEELRRKDPVKRTLVGGISVVVVVLLWAATLQFKIIAVGANMKGFEVKWQSIESGYKIAVESQRQLIEAEQKLGALENLRTNRFLWGSALNAFQQTLNGVEFIKVTRLRTEQSYTLHEEVKARKEGEREIPGRPATASEKITISVDAIDSSSQSGSQVTRFKDAILAVPYFKENLQQTNGVLLTSLSAPQENGEKGTPFVKFTLQCYFPEKTR